MRRQKIEKFIKEFVIMTSGVILMDIGLYFFRFPNNFNFGGVAGISVIADEILPFSTSMLFLIINMILLAVGFLAMGRGFGIKTAYATILSSVLLNVIEYIYPMDGPLTNQTALEFLYAMLLPGVGAAMLFCVNASSGGTGILAMILKKHTTMDTGTAVLVIDGVISFMTVFVFDMITVLYSLCGLFCTTVIINMVMDRMNLSKYFTIVCSDPDPICDYIRDELDRTATIYNAQGAYTGDSRTVILAALNTKQTVLLKRYIEKTEPEAFVMVTKSSEVMGKGFASLI